MGGGRNFKATQSGVVAILVAVLLTALLALVGLGVDSWIVGRMKERQDAMTMQAAQLAMQTFVQTAGTRSAKNTAVEKVVKRAVKGNIGLVEKVFFDGLPRNNPDITVSSDSAKGGDNGKLVPGIYHVDAPTSCSGQPSPCPCASGKPATPCFQPISPTSSLVPNAFRSQVALAPDSGVKTMFMRVLGLKTLKVKSEALAARKPRHVLFLLDLSRSSAQGTHLDYAQTGSSSSAEYAWKLPSSRSCSTTDVNACMNRSSCTLAGGLIPNYYDFLWGTLTKTRPSGSTGRTAPTKHYRKDFSCFKAKFKIGGGSSITERYLVDFYRGTTNSGGSYRGPEPLSGMLQAVADGLARIRDDDFPGDKAGFLGFDQSADIDLRAVNLAAPSATSFKDLIRATDVANQNDTKLTERFENFMLFPRVDAMSNLPAALERALEMLRADADFKLAENHVVVLSDGLSNCKLDGTCGTDEQALKDSLADAKDLLESEFKKDKIAVHLVLVGGRSGAHTLNAKSAANSDRCLDADEAAGASPPLAFANATVGTSDFSKMLSNSGNYYGVFALEAALGQTGGRIWPVRPCCKKSGACAAVQADLDAACKTAAGGLDSSAPSGVTRPKGVSVSPHTDSSGRLLCDPDGRDENSQLSDTISRILDGMSSVTVMTRE